jgi:hypothetical protein
MAKRTYHSPRAGSKPRQPVTHNNHPSDGELWQDCELCDFLRANPDDSRAVYYRTQVKLAYANWERRHHRDQGSRGLRLASSASPIVSSRATGSSAVPSRAVPATAQDMVGESPTDAYKHSRWWMR